MQHFETVCCIDKEVNVLKLTIKPGEFINIGDDVRVIYSGGSTLIQIRKLQDSYHLTTLSRDFLLKH